MNIIDLFIIIVFFFYIFIEFNRGFFRLCADLLGIIIAFLVALSIYIKFSDFLVSLGLAVIYARPLSFLGIWFVVQLIFFGISKIISYYTPVSVKQSPINIYAGILPAAVKAFFFIVVSLILIVVMPLNQKTKNLFTNSFFSQRILKYTIKFESQLEQIFGNSGGNNLTFVTNQGSNDDRTPLNFSTNQMTIDEEAEKILLEKINEERAKVGVQPLKEDILVRNVARIHSRDMLQRGYFSHVSTDGKTLTDRLLAANANFQTASENLALAPNANLVHLGLMNSEKHRENILDPSVTRVGIGVMDAGQYGMMVTQDFVN